MRESDVKDGGDDEGEHVDNTLYGMQALVQLRLKAQ